MPVEDQTDEEESLIHLIEPVAISKLSDKNLPSRGSVNSLTSISRSSSSRMLQTPTQTPTTPIPFSPLSNLSQRSACSTPMTSSSQSAPLIAGLIECTCINSIKRGRYIEETCQAHSPTLHHCTSLARTTNEARASSNKQPKHLPRRQSPVQPQEIDEQIQAIAKLLPRSPRFTTPKKALRGSKSSGALVNCPRDLTANSEALASLSLSPKRRIASQQKCLQNDRTGLTSTDAQSPSHHSPTKHDFSIHLLSMAPPSLLDKSEVRTMLEKYSRTIANNNESPEMLAVLFTRRSTLLAALGRYSESLGDAVKVLDLEPHATIGYFRKGFALCGLHRFTEASEAFQEGLKYDMHCNPLHHALQVSLRFVHLSPKNPPQAASSLR